MKQSLFQKLKSLSPLALIAVISAVVVIFGILTAIVYCGAFLLYQHVFTPFGGLLGVVLPTLTFSTFYTFFVPLLIITNGFGLLRELVSIWGPAKTILTFLKKPYERLSLLVSVLYLQPLWTYWGYEIPVKSTTDALMFWITLSAVPVCLALIGIRPSGQATQKVIRKIKVSL